MTAASKPAPTKAIPKTVRDARRQWVADHVNNLSRVVALIRTLEAELDEIVGDCGAFDLEDSDGGLSVRERCLYLLNSIEFMAIPDRVSKRVADRAEQLSVVVAQQG